MEAGRFVRNSGGWLVVGSLIGIGIGIKEAFAPTPFGTFENAVMQGIVIVVNTLTLVGVLGLVRSGAAGTGWLAKLGLLLAVLASALFLPFEVLVAINLELGGMLLGLSALVQGLGLLLAGIAVLRAGRWRGWPRFTPLLCGLYTFLVLIPALALSPEGYNAWALAGWQIPFALLGGALYRQGSPIEQGMPASQVA
jgi:uncharacterized membrane protein (DUF2068 family)